MLSSRGIRRTLFNSALYEFEDAVAGFDAVELFCPTSYHGDRRFDAARFAHRAASLAGVQRPGKAPLVPYRHEFFPTQDYDLLFATFDNPWDLGLVHAVKHFRERCALVACYIPEIWSNTLGSRRFQLENFCDYDHVFVGTFHDVRRLQDLSGVPCTSFPPAVDNLCFTPSGRRPKRVIDVVNLGRRSVQTHQALLSYAKDHDRFYLYDDVLNGEFPEPAPHRAWLADGMQRSNFSIANFARCDRPELTKGTREMGFRFVEGAAAGTVMLGAPPDTRQFAEQLPWEDAVIPVPVDAPGIAEVILDLEADPERVEGIRARNIAGSLRRHDWVYRWGLVLDTLGLPETPGMADRRSRLEQEAQRWEGATKVNGRCASG